MMILQEEAKKQMERRYLFLGMATQAFIVAGLLWAKLIVVSPGQQAIAGLIFLIVALIARRR